MNQLHILLKQTKEGRKFKPKKSIQNNLMEITEL